MNALHGHHEPAGDALTGRPVVLVAFGGSFIAGQRGMWPNYEPVSHAWATWRWRRIIAWASLLYNANTTSWRSYGACTMLRAAVQFPLQDRGGGWRSYRIDTDRIIVGGVSAGGIGAIRMAYLDQSSEIPETLYDDTLTIGGIEATKWRGLDTQAR
ncbi:MAG: hypothetical protein U0U25_03750 [Flavobacteriales bacterium]